MEEKKIRHFKKPKRKTCARAREKLLAKRAVLSNTRHTRTSAHIKREREREKKEETSDDRTLEAENRKKRERDAFQKSLHPPHRERARIKERAIVDKRTQK